MTTDTTNSCLFCIDGMAPTSSVLFGHCFQVCLSCQPICRCCDGHGLYPAWTKDLAVFLATYNAIGFTPVLCHTCGGVLAVVDDHEETP